MDLAILLEDCVEPYTPTAQYVSSISCIDIKDFTVIKATKKKAAAAKRSSKLMGSISLEFAKGFS